MHFYLWIVIIVLLTFVEVMTVNLTTIWYVIGGVCALIVSLFNESFLAQFGTFAIVGTLTLMVMRTLLKPLLKKGTVPTNADRLIGMIGTVTDDIKKDEIGEVKVDGKLWSAYSSEEIKKDEKVKVVSIDSVKLEVEKI
jgi:membrane protein implicated in regulation of membrane protease activity